MKEEVTIYHNPRCSKSRASLELITSMGVTPKVKLYLEEKILHEELDDRSSNENSYEILKMLKIKPHDLLRKSEKEYKEFNLENNELKDEDIIDIMIKNPILIQRPIVIRNNMAIIGRPPENILQIINK